MRREIISVLLPSLIAFACKKNDSATNPTPDPIGQQRNVLWPSLASSPWPMGHHDPQSTGRSQSAGGSVGQELWKIQSVGRVSSGVVLDQDGTLYYESVDSGWNYTYLHAVRPDSSLKWRIPLFDTVATLLIKNYTYPIVSSNGLIYIVSLDGRLYAINNNGTRKWVLRADDIIMTRGLTIGLDGTLYFVSRSGTLHAVDASGSVKWTKREGQGFWGQETGPPIVFSPDGATLYVGTINPGMYAVATNGDIRWFSDRVDNGFYTSRLLDSDGNIYSTHGDTIICLTPSGSVRWSHPARSPRGGMTMDLNGNLCCVVVDSAGVSLQILSLDYAGKERWRLAFTSSWAGELVCDGEGTVYAGTESEKRLLAIRSDGTVKWSTTFSIQHPDFSSSPAIGGDGTLYAPSGSTSLNWYGVIAAK